MYNSNNNNNLYKNVISTIPPNVTPPTFINIYKQKQTTNNKSTNNK